jgi:hypothetical protein
LSKGLLNAERLSGSEFLKKLEDYGFKAKEAHSVAALCMEHAHLFRIASSKLAIKLKNYSHGAGMIWKISDELEILVGVSLERDANEYFLRELGSVE